MKTIVVDYDAGNLRSVETALEHIGVEFEITADAERVATADRIVFPGVGDGAHAMRVLSERSLDRAMRERFAAGVPILGICVGCQIVLDATEERGAQCLGLVPGTAKRFAADVGKIPHMGWNSITYREGHWLFAGIPQNSSFYFVHSYYPAPADDAHAIAWAGYGPTFAAAIERGNLVATQFHPEKSGEVGLRVLRNFMEAR
ncbi:MAG: imidazole glycerol phosphate synthase subunit HisH [Spirochaetota bacterium]